MTDYAWLWPVLWGSIKSLTLLGCVLISTAVLIYGERKVWGAVRGMALLVLPVLVAATFFRPDWWWVHAGFGLGLLTLVAYAVVLKYAHYLPNERLSANGAHVSVAVLFAILPGLSLVPFVMLLTEWPKARANLHAYFDAHHH